MRKIKNNKNEFFKYKMNRQFKFFYWLIRINSYLIQVLELLLKKKFFKLIWFLGLEERMESRNS